MFRIASEKELLESFRPLEREEVILSEPLRFPLFVKDYLTWIEPAGNRVYLVFNDRNSGPPLGIVFRRDQSTGGTVGRMCEWCHSVGASDSVSLLTATVSSKRRVGIQLCRDLSCKEKMESNPVADDFSGSLTSRERVQKIVKKISLFARRELF